MSEWAGGTIGAGDGFISEADHAEAMEELAAAARVQIQEATDRANSAEYQRGYRHAEEKLSRLAAENYALGVKAAREAVAAFFDSSVQMMTDGHYSYFVPTKDEALAAIDALTGGDNSNGGNQP